MAVNIYKDILAQNINQVLTMYNLDPHSETLGYADRLYWGWKVSDFANGTMQGSVHALAVAIELGLVDNEDYILNIIHNSINAIPNIMANNGSMVEAYPGESSFCVTALVAFDVLTAIDVLGDKIRNSVKIEYLEIIEPLIDFITDNDEEHAIISNHLATGVAAITKWNKLTGNDNDRFRELLDVIYSYQSQEGWYMEYEGADPGYQTLCTYYLASAYEDTRNERLKESLINSGRFLEDFAHPNGSIGGLYGSRNTEVFYPGGIIALSNMDKSFSYLAACLEEGFANEAHVLPQVIDVGNYIPLLNAYAFAALRYDRKKVSITKGTRGNIFQSDWKETGIFVKSTEHYYAVVNYKKGGTVKVYRRKDNQLDIEDGGYFGRLRNGQLFSTQTINHEIDFKNGVIEQAFYKVNESKPTPFTTLILRGMALTVFQSLFLGNIFKKMIVSMLMTGKKPIDGGVRRTFTFNDDNIQIHDELFAPEKAESCALAGKAKAIHMASSGYYIPDISKLTEEPKIVKFTCD